MSTKLALIVDDSRSARSVLARMLERYQIDVDTVESAEDAIRYLETRRPDVIFMDHLMPGMDGFQAVQAIKKDLRTATIPIMMYTSQEGELYLSQARALGAVGVLPKQTKIADVSKALEQLHLIEEGAVPADTRRSTIAALGPVGAAGDSPAARLAALPPELRTLIESLLAEHAIELRRFVVERLDSNAERIVGDLRDLMHDGAAPAAGLGASVPPPAAAPLYRPLRLGALAAVLVAFTLAVLWWRGAAVQGDLQAQLAAARTEVAEAEHRAQAPSVAPAPLSAIAATGSVLIDPVPFGEAPLAAARIEHVQGLLEQLALQGFHGSVQVVSFPGRFCLNGSGAAATPAADDTSFAKCEQMGNAQDGTGPGTRESVAFANMLAAARRASGGTIDVQVLTGSAEDVLQPYPPVTDTLTAAQWNHIAAANNRVEVRVVPQLAAAAPATSAAATGAPVTTPPIAATVAPAPAPAPAAVPEPVPVAAAPSPANP